jgi:membrane associated rhomboid family serine protease
MNWIDSLEAKFGRLAIPGLLRVVVAFNALVYLLYKINPAFIGLLTLEPARILHGEIWRLATYIFIPQFGGIFPDYLSVVLYLWFLWFIGDGLEQAMGAFRLNLFYLVGMIGTTVAAFFFGSSFSSGMLNASLFYAFVRFYPDMEIYLFFVLPVKVKWLAWISAFFLLAVTPLMLAGNRLVYYISVVITLANYLIFFGPQIWREAGHRATVAQRRQKFERAAAPDSEALHCCVVCKRTNLTDPALDFRVGQDGNDYCTEHLPGKL